MASIYTMCPKCGYMPYCGEMICPKCKEPFIKKVVKTPEEIIEEIYKESEEKLLAKNPIPYCTSYL